MTWAKLLADTAVSSLTEWTSSMVASTTGKAGEPVLQ